MKPMLAACLMMTLTTGAAAANEMAALDFLVDGKGFAGQIVRVKDCTIIGALQSLVMCNVLSGRNSVGNVIVDGDTLDRTDLRRALQQCADMRPRKECQADMLIGTVAVNSMGDVRLKSASIYWKE